MAILASMKELAILDPAAGISGDMLLGALVDAGADPEWLHELPARLGCEGVEINISRVTRSSLTATRVEVRVPGANGDYHHGSHEHGRHLKTILDEVRSSPVSDWVQERALRAFTLLGEAEGKVHGVDPAEVHLHEVGAVDALIDIVGTVEGFEHLGIDEIYNLPVAIGSGWVDATHGKLPVPAPATAELLKGIEVSTSDHIEGEAATPTGAALLRALSSGPPPDRWRITTTGWGAGARDPAGYPNALRLLLASRAAEAGSVEVIVTDVDDMQPEYITPLREAVLEAGALDCVAWTTLGKKGRVGYRIESIAPPASAEAVVSAIFRNSTTAGVRRWSTTRATLDRSQVVVEVAPGVAVCVKQFLGPDGPRLKAEYGDVVAAAEQLKMAALDVARRAERLAEGALDHQET